MTVDPPAVIPNVDLDTSITPFDISSVAFFRILTVRDPVPQSFADVLTYVRELQRSEWLRKIPLAHPMTFLAM
jgi:hypothetical protein